MFRIIFAAALLCAPSLAYAETCTASHYGVGDGYVGRRTANGEIMNPRAMTAAHKTRGFRVACHCDAICGQVAQHRGPHQRSGPVHSRPLHRPQLWRGESAWHGRDGEGVCRVIILNDPLIAWAAVLAVLCLLWLLFPKWR